MKKKISILFLTFLICLLSIVPVFAEAEDEGFTDEYYRMMDMAGLLSDSDAARLLDRLDEISLRQKMDVTVATRKGSGRLQHRRGIRRRRL